jgi:DEAD/DEAH box helicase domain-containing protein
MHARLHVNFVQRQQSGRAGRRARDALSILVVESLPIDLHYLQHPDELFDGRTEDLVVDLDNSIILGAHLQCAAQEMPISLQDELYFGPQMRKLCETQLVKDKDGW